MIPLMGRRKFTNGGGGGPRDVAQFGDGFRPAQQPGVNQATSSPFPLPHGSRSTAVHACFRTATVPIMTAYDETVCSFARFNVSSLQRFSPRYRILWTGTRSPVQRTRKHQDRSFALFAFFFFIVFLIRYPWWKHSLRERKRIRGKEKQINPPLPPKQGGMGVSYRNDTGIGNGFNLYLFFTAWALGWDGMDLDIRVAYGTFDSTLPSTTIGT